MITLPLLLWFLLFGTCLALGNESQDTIIVYDNTALVSHPVAMESGSWPVAQSIVGDETDQLVANPIHGPPPRRPHEPGRSSA